MKLIEAGLSQMPRHQTQACTSQAGCGRSCALSTPPWGQIVKDLVPPRVCKLLQAKCASASRKLFKLFLLGWLKVSVQAASFKLSKLSRRSAGQAPVWEALFLKAAVSEVAASKAVVEAVRLQAALFKAASFRLLLQAALQAALFQARALAKAAVFEAALVEAALLEAALFEALLFEAGEEKAAQG